MPSIETNLACWGKAYDWSCMGDEWSSPWGGTQPLWWGTILPRIRSFVPTHTILEIAPGFGRCTQFLLTLAQQLVLVDLAESCIEACKRRFFASQHISYHVNDGKSLQMISDNSVDFAFSFDSLVHAEADVMKSYVSQLAMKLRPGGMAFLHHSNLGAYRCAVALAKKVRDAVALAKKVHPATTQVLMNIVDCLVPCWRSETMTAGLMRQYCLEAGLCCVSQELINWSSGKRLIDCFSVLAKSAPISGRFCCVVENPGFMDEARRVSHLARLYSARRTDGAPVRAGANP